MKYMQKIVGKRISWDFFGQPKGSYLKKGQGKVVRIEITLGNPFTREPLVRYMVQHNKSEFLEPIPQSCITKIHKERKK